MTRTPAAPQRLSEAALPRDSARPAARQRVVFWSVFAAALAAAAAPLALSGLGSKPALESFARLPVLEGGRVKPLDTFARNALLMLRGQQTLPAEGRRLSAVEWLLEALFLPEAADTREAFTLDDPDLLGLLGLERGRERRFSYRRLEPKREEIRAQAERAERLDASRRSRFQTAVVNLDRHLELYERIKNTLMVSGSGDPVLELAAFSAAVPRAVRALHGTSPTGEDKRAVLVLAGLLGRYRLLASAAAFRPLPPRAGEPKDAWASIGEAVLRPARPADRALSRGSAASEGRWDAAGPSGALISYARLARAHRKSDDRAFEESLGELEAWILRERPVEARWARAELLFNRAQPFITGMALYVAALLAVFAWWATRSAQARAAASAILSAAVLLHTLGLAARVLLQGRPPVTNLYSSAVFVGWVAAALGLAAERGHRKGFAAAGGALLGFCTLLVAHHLTGSGDTMEMMRAVLDSNFWLATHVVTVTIGYGSTFLAGALGVAWVARRHLVKRPDPEVSRALVSLAYGVVAFSLLFSFVGTVLGGIWADQSWGRFWGWDPKENGALLIVLWNAFILHARWAGLARERGVMVMTVFGNVVTSLSWFGVNMLGIGLHSYGFMDKAFWWLAAFVLSQLLVMAWGLLPPERSTD